MLGRGGDDAVSYDPEHGRYMYESEESDGGGSDGGMGGYEDDTYSPATARDRQDLVEIAWQRKQASKFFRKKKMVCCRAAAPPPTANCHRCCWPR